MMFQLREHAHLFALEGPSVTRWTREDLFSPVMFSHSLSFRGVSPFRMVPVHFLLNFSSHSSLQQWIHTHRHNYHKNMHSGVHRTSFEPREWWYLLYKSYHWLPVDQHRYHPARWRFHKSHPASSAIRVQVPLLPFYHPYLSYFPPFTCWLDRQYPFFVIPYSNSRNFHFMPQKKKKPGSFRHPEIWDIKSVFIRNCHQQTPWSHVIQLAGSSGWQDIKTGNMLWGTSPPALKKIMHYKR